MTTTEPVYTHSFNPIADLQSLIRDPCDFTKGLIKYFSEKWFRFCITESLRLCRTQSLRWEVTYGIVYARSSVKVITDTVVTTFSIVNV